MALRVTHLPRKGPQAPGGIKTVPVPVYGNQLVADLCLLLGPLVGELLRDGDGALNLSANTAHSFEEFRQTLIEQAGLNDGFAFRSPYANLIAKEKYRPLLESLFKRQIGPDSIQLLNEFRSELIALDADAFAGRYISSDRGRFLLATTLKEDSSRDQGADIAKAVARAAVGIVGEKEVAAVTDAISLWNYFNISVTDEELKSAKEAALSAILSAERIYKQVELRRASYATQSQTEYATQSQTEQISAGLGVKINPNKFNEMAALMSDGANSVATSRQYASMLAGVWLMAADDRNFEQVDGAQAAQARRYIFERIEPLIDRALKLETQQELERFNEDVRKFLNSSMKGGITGGLEHFIFDESLSTFAQELSHPIRAPLDVLIQTADEYHHAMDMGETVFREEKSHLTNTSMAGLIIGLDSAKRKLWHGYKRHKWISRALTQAAHTLPIIKQLATDDIEAIRKAVEEIGRFQWRLEQMVTDEDRAQVVRDIYSSLKKGGALYEAFAAAEMDGTEQLIGMIQTMAEIALPGLLPGGVFQTAARVAKLSPVAALGLRSARGFALGAYVATAENVVSKISDEVRRPEQDSVMSWTKDAIATGASMALTGALPQSRAAHESLFDRVVARYSVSPLGGIGRFGVDTGMEVVEEVVDNQTRRFLDGDATPLSGSELREIAMISAAGGGLKVGEIAEVIKLRQGSQSLDLSGLRLHPGRSVRGNHKNGGVMASLGRFLDEILPPIDLDAVSGLVEATAAAGYGGSVRRSEIDRISPNISRMDIHQSLEPESSELRRYLDTVLSPDELRRQLDSRRNRSLEDIVRDLDEDIRKERIRALQSGCISSRGHALVSESNPQMVTTVAGRNHTIIEHLRSSNYLPQRPLRILEGGAGMLTWEIIGVAIPEISVIARDKGFRSMGSSYEMVELASLAGEGGRVDVIEFDQRVIDAMHETLERGMIHDIAQASSLGRSLLTTSQWRQDPGESRWIFEQWLAYINRFIAMVGEETELFKTRLADGTERDVGMYLSLKPSVKSRIHMTHGDISITEFSSPYDLVWIMGAVFGYLGVTLWLETLFRAVAALPVSNEFGNSGGILVTQRFDMDEPCKDTPLWRSLPALFDLLGMKIENEMFQPLEDSVPIVIARRVRKSDWLDRKLEEIARLGIGTKP